MGATKKAQLEQMDENSKEFCADCGAPLTQDRIERGITKCSLCEDPEESD